MVNGVESLVNIEENYTVDKAIVNIPGILITEFRRSQGIVSV